MPQRTRVLRALSIYVIFPVLTLLNDTFRKSIVRDTQRNCGLYWRGIALIWRSPTGMFAYTLHCRYKILVSTCSLFGGKLPRERSSRFAVGMTGATMQIPNHYFRMSATGTPLVCVPRTCVRAEIRARPSVRTGREK